MTTIRSALAALALTLPLSGALAQEPGNCAWIASDRDRLACYDRAIGATRHDRGAAGTATWHRHQEPSEFTSDTNVYLSVESRETVDCGRNRDERLVLWLRCRENTTTVMLQTACHMTSGSHHNHGDVTYSLDGGAIRVVAMTKSRDNFSLGLWTGREAVPFIHGLFDAQVLSVRMRPFDAAAFTVAFDIAGLEEEIAPLRRACGW